MREGNRYDGRNKRWLLGEFLQLGAMAEWMEREGKWREGGKEGEKERARDEDEPICSPAGWWLQWLCWPTASRHAEELDIVPWVQY